METTVREVVSYPPGTIGYVDGDRLDWRMNGLIAHLKKEGWDHTGTNVVSSSRAFLTFTRPEPRLRSAYVPLYCPGCGGMGVERQEMGPNTHEVHCLECDWSAVIRKNSERPCGRDGSASG